MPAWLTLSTLTIQMTTVSATPAQRWVIRKFSELRYARDSGFSGYRVGARALRLDALLLGAAEQEIAQQRHERDGNNQRAEQQRYDGDTEFLEHHAGHAAGKCDRQEYGDRAQRGGDNCTDDLAGALGAGLQTVVAVRSIGKDVLQNNDGVIHDHTYAERDTAERHHVQRNAQHVHNQERKQDTARHCDGNSHGRAEVAQEKEQHDRGKQHAHPDVLNSVINRHVDIVGLIHNDIPLQGIVALKQGVKLSLGQLGNLRRIGAGLLVDRQDDTFLTVNLGDGVLILRLHGNIRNLTQTDRAACRKRDQSVLNIINGRILAVRADSQRLRTVIQIAARNGDVVRAELLTDGRNGQVIALQAGGVRVDCDLLLVAARNINRRYAAPDARAPAESRPRRWTAEKPDRCRAAPPKRPA